MRARQATTITVGSSEEIERLEREIRSGDESDFVIELPEWSTALLAVGEVRCIMSAARESGASIEFATDDPLRRELLSILGGVVRPLHGVHPQESPASERSSSDDLTRRIGYVRAAAPTRSSSEQRTARIDDSEPSFSFVLTPPVSGRSAFSEAQHEPGGAPAPAPTLRSRPRRGRTLATLTSLTAIVSIAAVVAWFLVPTATVTVVPAVTTVSAEITYGVALPGTSWDVSVQPTNVDVSLTFSGSMPTTGERTEPNGTAGGVVQFTNASTSEAFVPAGTELTSDSGVAFVTLEDVSVPAADPFGTLTFGSTTVSIQAVAAGTTGNVGPEAIAGQLDSGIFYTNREATTGGSTRQIQTVSQADIDALQVRATNDLNSRITGELAASLGSGQQLLDGSVQPAPIQFTFDHAAGSDASEIKLAAVLNVHAQAYTLDDVHSAARDRAAKSLSDRAGSAVRIQAGTIELSEPEPIAGSPAPAFRIHAEARAEALIDPDTLRKLPSSIAGQSRESAIERASAIPGVAAVTIDRSPAWLPFGMPRMASRIEVIVAGTASNGEAETSGATTGP